MTDRLLNWAEDHPRMAIGILGVTFPVWAIPALLLGMGLMTYETLMEHYGD